MKNKRLLSELRQKGSGKMKNMTLANVAKACSGEYIGYDELKNIEIKGVVKDNREIKEGYLFIPFVGEKVDAHKFIPDAFSRGALCTLSERYLENPAGPYIKVDSSAEALKSIAEFYREQISTVIIGITGSVGKTSTKEVVASVLKEKYCVHKTEANYNNEIGMPLTILQIRDEHQIAVVEMGISEFGEMRRLSKIAKPDICVITNIGTCHLENLGDRDGILRAKSEIFDYMNPSGQIILNGDDDKLITIKDIKGITPEFYGTNRKQKVFAENIKPLGLIGTSVDIAADGESINVTIPVPGAHMVSNSLAAVCIGKCFDMSLKEIKKGIESLESLKGRNNIIETEKLTIIDDCYNANPMSMKASLEVLSYASGRKVAILGGMNELGDDAEAYHREVGRYAGAAGIDAIICIGDMAEKIGNEAAETALAVGNSIEVTVYYKKEEFENILDRIIIEGDTVLVKASHSFGFDTIVKKLTEF